MRVVTTGRADTVRQWPRRVALATLSLLAAPAIVVTALSAPAHASTGSISDPPAGQTYTNTTTLLIKAQVRRGLSDGGKVTLTFQQPGSSTEYEVASHSGGSTSGGDYPLQYNFDPSCPTFPGVSCSGRPTPNGTHTVRLRGTSSPVERTFVMRVAPRKPTGVSASATGQRQVTVRWDRGAEPDLAGYDLFTNGDTLVERGIAPGNNEHVVNYPETGYEGRKDFYLVAQRRACAGCSETLASPRSDTASATLDPPPPPPPSADPNYTPPSSPSPTPAPGGGASPGSTASPSSGSGSGTGSGSGSSGGGTPSPGASGGSGSGGTGSGSDPSASGGAQPSATSTGGGRTSSSVISLRRSFAQQFRNFAPTLGAPKLPPLPDFAEPEIAEDEGTYEESLDFGEQDIEELFTSAQGGGQRSVVEEFVSTAFEGRKLWSSIGWSLVLFLIAGHLRRWLNSPQHD